MKTVNKSQPNLINYIKAIQGYIDRENKDLICYHRWNKESGICIKCGHINTLMLDELYKDVMEYNRIK